MSRSKPSWLAQQPGQVYTLHFWPPYGDPQVQVAKHYTGWAENGRLSRRLADHTLGRGARLTQVQRQAGGSWIVAGVEPGTRDRETQLKERSASRRCRVCKAERDYQAGTATAAEALKSAGWAGATPHERTLLLDAFGLDAAPADLASLPAPEQAPEPGREVKLWHPRAVTVTAEHEALVNELEQSWLRDPKAEAEMEFR